MLSVSVCAIDVPIALEMAQLSEYSKLTVTKEYVPPWDSDPAYIDATGMSRGVPNENKLVVQIAARVGNVVILPHCE